MASRRQWQIKLSGEEARELAEESPLFREVVKLGRAVNSIRTCRHLLVEDRDEDFPRTQRLRMTAFLYVAALLFETFEFVRSKSQHLHELDSFKKHFRPLIRDRDVVDFINGPLKALRNQGVFHFRDESIPNALTELQDDDAVFQVGEGRKPSKVYHLLSDWAVLHAAFDLPASPEEASQFVVAQIERVAELSNRVATAGDWLVAEGLKTGGWEMEEYTPVTDD